MTGQPKNEILLDASALAHPEPLQQALQILQELTPGQYLRMLHRRLPYPLFDACQQLGIVHRHFTGTQTAWIILFWRDDDPVAAEHCQQITA
jgi:hypothetical protein